MVSLVYKIGDCLDFMREMPDKCVDLVLTDPPYGINYQSNMVKDKSKLKPKIANDMFPFTEWLTEAYRICKDGARLLCFYRWDVQQEFVCAINETGFILKSQVIWDKVIHGMGDLNGQFAPCHESILYATKGKYQFTCGRPNTVFRFPRVNPADMVHPNEKPVNLFKGLLLSTTKEGDLICDPFLGSGTTLRACRETNRNCIGFEKEPMYEPIIRKRAMLDIPDLMSFDECK